MNSCALSRNSPVLAEPYHYKQANALHVTIDVICSRAWN